MVCVHKSAIKIILKRKVLDSESGSLRKVYEMK